MWHEISYLWFGYAWPSLKGNGPEALIQTVAYAAIALVVYPPLRNFIKREAHSGEQLLHTKLDHIIFHSKDIPSLPETLPTDTVGS